MFRENLKQVCENNELVEEVANDIMKRQNEK